MASNNNNEINITFKAFNQNFNSAIREMDGETKRLRQEMKLQEEQMKHTATATDKLESKVSGLQQIYEVQRQKTQKAADELERAKQLWGENSQEVAKMTAQLKRHQIAEQQAANAVTESQQALEKAQKAQKDQQNSLKQLNNILQVTGSSLGDFSDLLGQELAQAIRNGTASSAQLEKAFKQIAGATQSASVDIDQVRQALSQLDNGASVQSVRDSLQALSSTTSTVEDEVNRLQQALKLQQEEMKHSATQSQKLQTNVLGLEGIYEGLRRATNETEQALAQARGAYGENSAEAKKLESQLVRNRIAEQQMANSVKEARQAQEQHATSLTQLNRLFDVTGRSVDDFANELGTDLVNAIREGRASASQLDSAFDQISRSALGANTDLQLIQQTLRNLDSGSSIEEVRQELERLQQESQQAEESVNELSGAFQALGGILAGVGIAEAMEKALEVDDLKAKIDVTFDVPESSKASIREALADVKKYGVDGEEALEGLRRQFALNKDASDETNASVVRGAASIAYAYTGIDFTELIQETNEIGKELNISDEEALNLVNSLLKIGFPPEQLDIIAEYGSQLQRAGYEANEIKGILAAAVNTGSWNIDNLLDGLKEGRVRATEMGSGLTTAMRDSLKIATDDGKKMSDVQLSNMQSSMAKQESALSSSLNKRLKAVSENYDKQKEHLSKTLDKEYEAVSNTYKKQEDALEKSLSKKQDALSASFDKQKAQLDKALEQEYESASSSYEKQEKDLEKSLNKKTDAVKDSYEKQKDELEKALEKEYTAFEKSTEKKIALIDKEYTEKLKLIDEEKYNQIKAIDSQINRLDSLSEAEDKAAKRRENANRRADLLASISSAKTAKERQTASKNLAEFDERMRLEAKKEARKGVVDSLKDRKEQINEEFSAKKDALKEEQNEVKAQAKETADEAKKALKEEQAMAKKELDDKAKESLKILAEANKNEIVAFRELNKQKLKVLKEEQAARKIALDTQAKNEISAMNERVKAEVTAFKDVNKQKLSILKEEQDAHKSALDKRISDQLEAARSANQSELESFKEMNQKKLEMAKNPPDSAQFQALEKQLVGWGKAIAKGGEEGSQAFEDMVKWLDSIEDATERNAIGVAVFGTMWEDQGENIVDSILNADDALKELEKSEQNVNDAATQIGETSGLVQLREAAEQLIIALDPLFTVIANVVGAFATWATNNPKIAAAIVAIGSAVGILVGAFAAIGPALLGVVALFGGGAGTTGLMGILSKLGPFLLMLGTKILPILKLGFAALTGPVGIAIAILTTAVPLIIKHWDSIKEFFSKLFSGIWEGIKKFGQGVVDFFKQWGPNLLTILTGPLGMLVRFVVKNWNSIRAKTSEIFGKVKGIAGTIFQSIYTNTINKVVGLKDRVAEIFGKLKDGITRPIEKARDAIKNAIDKIKSFFNFSFKWPDLKVPKLKIKKGSLNPMKWFSEGFPEIDIQWFAKGGVMTRPTLFGGSGNTAFVGGEAGPEAVLPLNERVLGSIGNAIHAASGREMSGQQVVNNFEKMLDGAVFHVREEADIKKIARELGDYTKVRERGGRR